jgi:hypothetical protein
VVSSPDITEEIINSINGLIDSVEYECFAIELMNHPISSYMIGAFDYIFKKNEVNPILFSKNGTIYMKKKNQENPAIEEVNRFLNQKINDEFSSKGILQFDNRNVRIYTNPKDFLLLASNINKFLGVANEEISRRLSSFKRRKDWNEKTEKVYLLGRVCGSVHNSLIKTISDLAKELSTSDKDKILEKLKTKEKVPFAANLGGRADEKSVESVENVYGKDKSYKKILELILKKFSEEINIITKSFSGHDVTDLMIKDSRYHDLGNTDIQKEAGSDYDSYWNKNPIDVCRVCHTFKQEPTSAALFPASDLGGGKDVFLTDLMRRSPEFKNKGGVCKWCKLWFMLLKIKTENRIHKLCIFPHALFGRIEWDNVFDPGQTIGIGMPKEENYIYPHVAVIGLSGKRYADFISQAVRNKILDKLFEYGLRGKVFSTLGEPSFYLFDCGGIKIRADEYTLFKPILENVNLGKGANNYALAIKSLKSNKYSWGYLIKTGKLNNNPRDGNVIAMVKEMGEQTGLSFLKNIWVGGKSPENRISNAEKIVRRMNETLRKLKDKEKKDVVIDAMVSIGRKVAVSTREFRDWANERRRNEVDALKKMAEKLYEYKENGAQRTELVRAMTCYLGYIPYTIGSKTA